MYCSLCNTSLSLQDVDRNIWKEQSEEFIIKCPVCQTEKILISELFEHGHINKQYFAIIVSDSDSNNKEKLTDYIPQNLKQKIFDHLSSCQICSEKIEEFRLNKIFKKINLNEETYNFFIKCANDVIIELNRENISFKNNNICSFKFENQTYTIDQNNIFYSCEKTLEGIKIEQKCYLLEKNSYNIGMVSFVFSNNKIILEKIWLKSEQRLEKEKTLLTNLKNGKIRILFELIDKLQDFI